LGEQKGFSDLGWLGGTGKKRFGERIVIPVRPLLVSDDRADAIYRIHYKKWPFFLDTRLVYFYHFRRVIFGVGRRKEKEVNMKKKFWVEYLLWYLIGAMFVIGITPRAFAGFSPSEATSLAFDRPSDLEKVRKVLEMRVVREKLKEFGFTTNEIEKRLSELSDDQIHQIALQIDELKVGGDGWAVAFLFLLIAILIVLVIYVTGHRVVVK